MSRRRRRREQGAMAVLVALVTCFVLIPVGALTVDIGMQRVARQDMQSLADTVALDMARSLAGGTAPTDALARASAGTVSGTLGSTPVVHVYTGSIGSGSSFVSDQGLGCGGASPFDSYFTAAPAGTNPNAVLVVASTSVSLPLHGGSGGACRSSIAVANQVACFSVGSYAAQLNAGNSAVLGPLTALLGSSIDASVLSSSGLATTNVDVLGLLKVLQTKLGVGSLDQVLTTSMTAGVLLDAEAQVLTQQGASAAAVSALNSQLVANIGRLSSSNLVQVGSLLGLSQGAGSALGAQVNALDLAMGTVYLANGNHALGLSVATPSNISGISAVATLVQKAQTGCGKPGAAATSSQVSLDLTATLTGQGSLTSSLVAGLTNLIGSVLGLVTGHTVTVSVGQLVVHADLAKAQGTLTAIDCEGLTANDIKVAESSTLAPARVTLPITITDTYRPLIGAPTVKTATLTTTVTTVPAQPLATTGTFVLPGDYGQARSGPSGNLSLNTLSVSTVAVSDPGSIIGGLFGGLSSVVNSIGSSLVVPIESTVLTPLLTNATTALQSLFGVTLAGSTYTALPTASCGSPQLVG